jgi:hypothetical protein
MLNSLRFGTPDQATCANFCALSREVNYDDGVEPCELCVDKPLHMLASANICHRFPLREQVRQANESRLAKLPGDIHTFQAMDIGGIDMYGKVVHPQQATTLLDKHVLATEMVQLKVSVHTLPCISTDRKADRCSGDVD